MGGLLGGSGSKSSSVVTNGGLSLLDQYSKKVGGPVNIDQYLPSATPLFQSDGSGYDNAAALGLGFGRAPTAVAAPASISAATPTITAPTAQAAQSNVSNGDYDKYQQSIYQSIEAPQAQELQRQQDLATRQLADQEGNSGLGASAAGVGMQQKQLRDFGQRQSQVSADAAAQAATQRYGAQFQEAQQNAERQQATNLANAGYSLQAQQQNAANVLAGKSADADNYLKTIGLNQQAAAEARQSFLQLEGLKESDIQRLSGQQLNALQLRLNNYLQTFGAVINAGETSSSKSVAPGLLSVTSYGPGGGFLNSGM